MPATAVPVVLARSAVDRARAPVGLGSQSRLDDTRGGWLKRDAGRCDGEAVPLPADRRLLQSESLEVLPGDVRLHVLLASACCREVADEDVELCGPVARVGHLVHLPGTAGCLSSQPYHLLT